MDRVPESMSILWENTSIFYVMSCVFSILVVAITHHYTRNLSKLLLPSSSAKRQSVASSVDGRTEEESSFKSEVCHHGVACDGPSQSDTSDILETRLQEEDPFLAAEHIPPEFKKMKERAILKQIESELTEDQKRLEKEVQQRQLHEIFKLVEHQREKYGISSMSDVEEQMKLYAHQNVTPS